MIEVQKLAKIFKVHQKEAGLRASIRSLFHREWREVHALRDASFAIEAGELVGLVGANGAGKTTLTKILAGIIYPSAGDARILGSVPWERPHALRRQISLVMGQKNQLWWDLPAADCFQLLQEIYEVPRSRFHDTVHTLCELLEISHLLTTQIRRLSLGERMKMELVAALAHEPKVVFLDEPTIGLDFTAQRAIRKFLLDYRAWHKPAMILTSHYMEDIESLCDRLMIMKDGELVYDGALQEVVQSFSLLKTISLQLDAYESAKEWHQRLIEAGHRVELSGEVLNVTVPKESSMTVASRLLRELPVVDVSIHEEEISVSIERYMRHGKKGTDQSSLLS